MIAPVATEVHRRLGDVVFSLDDETLEQVVSAASAGVGPPPRLCGVAHRWKRGGPHDRGRGIVDRSSSAPPSCTRPRSKHSVLGVQRVDPRRARRRESRVRARDGGREPGACMARTSPSRSPAPPVLSLTAAPSPAPCGSASTPTTSATREGTSRRATVRVCAGGRSSPPSTWFGATSMARPCPRAIASSEGIPEPMEP